MADGPAVLAAIGPLKTSAVTTASAIAPARVSSPSTSRGQLIQGCGVSSEPSASTGGTRIAAREAMSAAITPVNTAMAAPVRVGIKFWW